MTNASKLISIIAFVVFGSTALSGCATNWYSNKFATEDAKSRQLKIDTGYCEGVSYGVMPLPEARIYTPGQTSYNVSGTGSGYDSSGNYSNYQYSGTIQPRTSGAEQFASGFANGYAAVAQIAATNARTRVYTSCMLRLGWSDKPLIAQTTESTDFQKMVSSMPPSSWVEITHSEQSPVYIDSASIIAPNNEADKRLFWVSANFASPLDVPNTTNKARSVQILAAVDCNSNTIATFESSYTSEKYGTGVVVEKRELNKKFHAIDSATWMHDAKQFACQDKYNRDIQAILKTKVS